MSMETNALYYGDNLEVLRSYIPDNCIDLIYLDPPFNSQATYNILFREPTGKPSEAQIKAFEDTWHWSKEAEKTFQEIVDTAPVSVVKAIDAFRSFIGNNDMTAYLTMMCIRLLELKRVLRETGSIYLHCDPVASHYLKILMDTIFGKTSFQREIVWRIGWVSGFKTRARNWVRNHDVLLFYTKTNRFTFNKQLIPHQAGYQRRGATGPTTAGKPVDDVWIDIYSIMIESFSREKTGFPTQKPEALLERIIRSSSNEGDIVLDPFCGCGTAMVSAHRLNRRWIGIDITHLAISLVKWRLEAAFPGIQCKIIGEPVDTEGAKELARNSKYQFQWWALSRIGARPYGDAKKKGADTGIDGYCYFMDEKDKVKKSIVQVKGGSVSVKDIRDLSGVMEREKAEIGIFLTLLPPTEPMQREAISKGFYRSPLGKDYPRMQILTIEELLIGQKPDTPPWVTPVPFSRRSHPRKNNTLPLL